MFLVFDKHNKKSSAEKGFSMVELLVSTMVAVLVVAGVYSFYYAGLRSWDRGVLYKNNQQNARLAIKSVEQDIRYADWIWIGENWENNWKNESFIESDESDQIYYIFWGDKRKGENRPHLIFNKIWLGDDNTIYLRRRVLLTELNSMYYVNPAPYPLADKVKELKFTYDANRKNVIVFIKAGDNEENLVKLKSSIKLRNNNYCLNSY